MKKILLLAIALILLLNLWGCKSNKKATTLETPVTKQKSSGNIGVIKAVPLPNKFSTTLTGKLGDKLKIELRINRRETTYIYGEYFYGETQDFSSEDRVLVLSGDIDANGHFKLTETTTKDKVTGTFDGTLIREDTGNNQFNYKAFGQWKKAGDNQTLPFSLTQKRYELGNNLELVQKQFSEEQPNYTIFLEYPQLTDSDKSANFNEIINKLVAEQKASLKEDSQATEPEATPDPTAEQYRTEASFTYQIIQANSKVISLLFEEYQYQTGAAHGMNSYATINYLVEEQRVVKLAELFQPDANYLQKISDYCALKLAKKLGPEVDSEQLNAGLEPIDGNFDAWCLTSKGLLIQFDPYQVASYAVGAPQVFIPYSELKDIWNPTGPLANIVTSAKP